MSADGGGGDGGGGGSDACAGGSSVDLSVVDYVLKRPFSDESFRRLLEAVEADHLQVGYGITTGKKALLTTL